MAVLVASPAVWLPRDVATRCEPLRFTWERSFHRSVQGWSSL